MSYREYLQSEYWRTRRQEFKSNTWLRCFICRNKEAKFNVHHKRYVDKIGASVLFKEKHTDLRLLCESCHHKIHKYHLEDYLRNNKVRRVVLRDLLRSIGRDGGEKGGEISELSIRIEV